MTKDKNKKIKDKSKGGFLSFILYPLSRNAGLTLIEAVIVVATLMIISALALASFVNSRNVRDLTINGQNILSVLRRTQSRALAGDENDQWGIRLEQTRYTLFKGPNFASSATTTVYDLPQNLEIVNITLSGGGQDIVFKLLSGETDQFGTFDLRVKDSVNLTFPITVEPSGKVFRTGTAPPPSGARIVDARHRAFNLGWSIKTSTTLTLTFSDPQNPDTVYPVAMASYFDAARTKFDWSGKINVGGEDQILRIHTTFLDDTNTVLHVDRDCRKNNKKVAIVIDTRDIATFEADCRTVTVGAYGGTMTEP